MKSQLLFGSWIQRGNAMPIRFLLEYTQTNYNEKIYYSENESEWFQKDQKQFKQFANLPYIIDGDLKLTDVQTIMRYIAKRNSNYIQLLGQGHGNDEDRINQINLVISEIGLYVKEQFFNPKVHEEKRDFLNRCQKKFGSFVNIRGKNKFIFPYVTTADFNLVELLLHYKCLDNELFEKNLPSLNEYIQHFYNLPAIKDYTITERYQMHTEFFPQNKAIISGKDFITKFNSQFKK
ncbi:glutathione S-transferase, amine-terminal domain protein (macronuclear) [Tetrahymena thermophila SB210]|uniref:glutathione transferase n=1 Tax=Tetrahymena thermophila (strain SB210) TaxID=312017 RepID=Q23G08_TETTS|nr:glutathione S-transferase, amine-terminal domain protein [Tetrahymena thermophila SB210]EAR95452.2 glutathione S-transferase, amine-terminal domain protein [Tetrahymena thermophila SB210]|eukprot:XP_001015697.2 glutathione S-transferase, amine-terminal domain protein [Tetrahymena thermophila SB210]